MTLQVINNQFLHEFRCCLHSDISFEDNTFCTNVSFQRRTFIFSQINRNGAELMLLKEKLPSLVPTREGKLSPCQCKRHWSNHVSSGILTFNSNESIAPINEAQN